MHSPAVPAAGQPATITVKIAESTQSVTSATLTFTVIDGGAGSDTAAMSSAGNFLWSAQIPGQTAGRLGKFVANPVWKRLYWGHVHDICTTTYNSAYMTPWAAHYTKFVNQNLSSFISYITTRSNYALGQVNTAVPNVTFAITTTTGGSPGTDFSAPGPVVDLDGDGWVNVLAIRVNGGAPVNVTWTDEWNDSADMSVSLYSPPEWREERLKGLRGASTYVHNGGGLGVGNPNKLIMAWNWQGGVDIGNDTNAGNFTVQHGFRSPSRSWRKAGGTPSPHRLVRRENSTA